MSDRTRTFARQLPRKAADPQPKRPVSKPGDPHEREAERAAETVARGGSVSSFSFSALPASSPAPVQREEKAGGKPDDEKKEQEALKKAGEAALATEEGKALKEKVLADPLVKTVKDAVTSTPGLIVTGAAAAGGVAALAATGKELPFQPPEIPLDKITPGLSGKVTYEGPVNAPTFVGLSITYKEQGPKVKGAKKPDPIAADIARLRAQDEMFRRGQRFAPGSKEAEEQRLLDQAVANYVLRGSTIPGLTIPLVPPAPKKQEEKTTPVQPAPATAGLEPAAEAHVDDALASPGRPLDPSTRRSMESRFGYDFSSVRVHDDARAAAAAAGIDAAAFTVGEDVVFAPGRYDPAGYEGRRLLAHELAHVVQQSRRGGGAGPLVQRRSIFESLGILLGLEEGTWEDRELHEYLDAIVRADRIEGAYDSDNKARAIVRRWKASAAGFDLLPRQKVLLIDEMLDGPTLGEDEECILDLLELSDASDLRAMFAPGEVDLGRLESDIHDENRTRLDTWVSSRFRGGRDEVLAGRLDVVGTSVPPGAPRHGFDAAILDARFDSDRTLEELIDLVAAMPDADRTAALHHLATVRRPRQHALVEGLERRFAEETDPTRQSTIREVLRRKRRERLKTEQVIAHFFREAALTSPGELERGTSPTDPARQAEVREALRPPTGGPAGTSTFRDRLPGETETYEEKVRAQLPTIVQDAHDSLVAGRGPAEHRDPARVHTLLEFEAIGNVAKDETDAVFGQFYSADDHPPLRADRPRRRGNVHDQFAETERDLARMTTGQRREMAKALVFYFFQTEDAIRRLNRDHDAAPEFDDRGRPQNDEARALDRVATEFVRPIANVRRLNEIDRNWPATARPSTGEIFFQLFREPTPEADRLLLWDVFQTFIHEYIHTLVNRAYSDFADTFGTNSNEWNTLIEGVDSLLTEIVWDAVEPRVGDATLREQIEGPANAALPPVRVPHAAQRRYPSYTEALRLADLVGIRNVYAAYFLGLVDRIGGPAPATGGTP